MRLILEARPAESFDRSTTKHHRIDCGPVVIGRYHLPNIGTLIDAQKPQPLSRYPGEPDHEFVARFLSGDLRLL